MSLGVLTNWITIFSMVAPGYLYTYKTCVVPPCHGRERHTLHHVVPIKPHSNDHDGTNNVFQVLLFKAVVTHCTEDENLLSCIKCKNFDLLENSRWNFTFFTLQRSG